MGAQTISDRGHHDQPGAALLAVLFAKGARPTAANVAKLAAGSGTFAIVFEASPDEGWVEALIAGLSFELAGLAPSPAAAVAEILHSYGFAAAPQWGALEPVLVRAGPHLAGGEAMLPVVRASVAVAAALAAGAGAQAVVWLPARIAMSPGHFAQASQAWLSGGAFPALGLTALAPHEDGSVASEGLEFFIGQELRVDATVAGSPGDRAKLAVRLIDRLIRDGAIGSPTALTGPNGEALLATPSPDGAQLTVRAAS